jgi:hypothetical protein
MAVIGAHEVRLRSSAHPSHVLDRFYRHGGILALSRQHSVVSIQWSAFSQTYLPQKDAKAAKLY